MSKIAVSTDHAPGAIGPYSQAVKTGELVKGGIEAETRRALENLTGVLAAAGATWVDVVRTTIFLTDLSHFTLVNQLYGERVGATPPSRTTIQVAALPRGALVEIDAIAHLGKASSSAT